MPDRWWVATFITTDAAAVEARWPTPQVDGALEYGKQLGAAIVIMQDPEIAGWSIYEMRKCVKHPPQLGNASTWGIPMPLRTFPADALDATVMWAIAAGMRG